MSNQPQAITAASAGIKGLLLGRPRTRHDHLDALDGLRGLAVMIVLGSHLSNGGWLPAPALSGAGKSGVYLFFVLSAFLLTRALLQRGPRGLASTRLWTDYALRRVLRIWPLYLVVLLGSWALTQAGVTLWHYQLDTPGLLRHLALRQGQSVLWSIPVEFTFYLWLPLLALALAWLQAWRLPPWALALVATVAIFAAMLAWPPASTLPNDVRLGPYLVVFLCGSFAALVDLRLRTDVPTQGPGEGLRLAAWGVVGLGALLACAISVPSVWAALTASAFNPSVTQRWFLWFGVAWSLLLLAVLHGPAWLRDPFASAPARVVGVVSFSAYLWHMPVLDGLRNAGLQPGAMAAVLVLAAVLMVSVLSFLLFERPFREVRLPRRVARSPPRLQGPHEG